jgi:hypothetical protein
MKERYVLRVHGTLGPLVRHTLVGVRSRYVPAQTTITGTLSDDDLRALLTRLDHYGIQVVSLERLTSAA